MAVYSIYREDAPGVIVETYTETAAVPISSRCAALKLQTGYTYWANLVSGTPVPTPPSNPGGIGGTAQLVAPPVPFVKRPSAGGCTWPRWRGMNMLNKYARAAQTAYVQADFVTLGSWGFNFARLTLDHLCFTAGLDLTQYQTSGALASAIANSATLAANLANLDQAVRTWGPQNSIHINLSLLRAPGYAVGHSPTDILMFNDPTPAKMAEARRQTAMFWGVLAQRYADVSPSTLSFGVINEPPDVGGQVYYQAVVSSVDAIRAANPLRPLVFDGQTKNNKSMCPVPELKGLGGFQATHAGYYPFQLTTQYTGSGSGYPAPTWPLAIAGEPPVSNWSLSDYDNGSGYVDQTSLQKYVIRDWLGSDIGVFAGEFGARGQCPHDVMIAWATDLLKTYQQYDMGWCFWSFKGDDWALLDNSVRTDIPFGSYTDSAGTQHTIDSQLLALLQAY